MNNFIEGVFVALVTVTFCVITTYAAADSWTIFYQLVPQPPAKQDVGRVGGFDRGGGAAVKELIVKPQTNPKIETLIAQFGKPDSIGIYSNSFPLVLPFKVTELKPEAMGEAYGGAYGYYSLKGETYRWGDITLFVKDKMVRLIFVKGSDAEARVFAPQSNRSGK